ncbi:MAG: hypothetical protein HOH20_04965 [Rhodospirillaceae bacterium]|jgi:hypothetical protein|nr:hypothetical protein [Rhodospirillaceae bacterium]MBT5241538.1 hypothetical protein [Rhodospirillaceae bacterium]MBT5566192.1 hypothetical protein [Rhodospirillaceae bacterium]MBT6088910.1 hypothetical protein [Rhodospirillaceae bacterium]MBT6960101.1 hypothetical protein [Rhodospirillaceae bacterium]
MQFPTLVRSFGLLIVVLAQAAVAQDTTPARSSFFAMETGAHIEDAGVLTVARGPFARTEAFEVVRRADGGRTVTSVITGAGESYRAEGRWDYDANELATFGAAKTSYDGMPTDIEIVASPPGATITVSADGVRRSVPAPCDPDCLIDMSPSALPMFTMTRTHSGEVGDSQRFRWIAQALTLDQTLLKGHADIRLLKTQSIDGLDVSQFIFVETITRPDTGEVTSFAFNLWVDDAHRPLAFDTVGGTLGTRAGFESITADMPPIFD